MKPKQTVSTFGKKVIYLHAIKTDQFCPTWPSTLSAI